MPIAGNVDISDKLGILTMSVDREQLYWSTDVESSTMLKVSLLQKSLPSKEAYLHVCLSQNMTWQKHIFGSITSQEKKS